MTPEEHKQLIQMSDRLEQLNVTRIQALIQLATFRNQPVTELMQTLGCLRVLPSMIISS